jgi:hypothetical protein
VAAERLPSLSLDIEGERVTSSTLAQPQVKAGYWPKASVVLPLQTELATYESYEVQMTMLYANPLLGGEMPYKCIESTNIEYWNSAPVLQPVGSSGHVELIPFRQNVPVFGTRKCSPLGNAIVLNVREFGSPYQVRMPYGYTYFVCS